MCRVAEGGADGFVSFGPKHAWDVCGAAVVLWEAGGLASTGDGEPLPFSAGGGGTLSAAAWSGLVAGTPPAHAELLRAAALAPERPGR
jgi:myo-inositol-1(or 4)-monophosphatase